MKIILSRKGFDSSNGRIPSPILPDGTLLSLPIPGKFDNLSFDDLNYNGVSFSNILKQLRGKEDKKNQDAFNKLMVGRTSFVIAHRLSTIENADLILVMVDGNIVEHGDHSELLAQKGIYYKMQTAQLSNQ